MTYINNAYKTQKSKSLLEWSGIFNSFDQQNHSIKLSKGIGPPCLFMSNTTNLCAHIKCQQCQNKNDFNKYSTLWFLGTSCPWTAPPRARWWRRAAARTSPPPTSRLGRAPLGWNNIHDLSNPEQNWVILRHILVETLLCQVSPLLESWTQIQHQWCGCAPGPQGSGWNLSQAFQEDGQQPAQKYIKL